MASCTVCNTEGTKYKCVSCKAPSCSLPCFKQHKTTCPSESTISHPSAILSLSDNTQNTADTTTSTTPFSSQAEQHPQITRSSLEALFLKHPGLKAQLRDVYNATLDSQLRPGLSAGDDTTPTQTQRQPQNSQQRSSGHRYQRNERWTQEKGIESGVERLRILLDGSGQGRDGGEGMREFMELVSR